MLKFLQTAHAWKAKQQAATTTAAPVVAAEKENDAVMQDVDA